MTHRGRCAFSPKGNSGIAGGELSGGKRGETLRADTLAVGGFTELRDLARGVIGEGDEGIPADAEAEREFPGGLEIVLRVEPVEIAEQAVVEVIQFFIALRFTRAQQLPRF